MLMLFLEEGSAPVSPWFTVTVPKIAGLLSNSGKPQEAVRRQLYRCYPTQEEKNHVWGQDLVLGGMHWKEKATGHVLFLPVQIYFTVLLGLHAGCSSQGDGGVVIFVHVTSDKRLCSPAFGLQPVCPALSTLALEKASTCVLGRKRFSFWFVYWWWNSKDKVLSVWYGVRPKQLWGTQNFLVTEKLEAGPCCHPSWERKRKGAEIAVDRVTPTVLMHFVLPYWDLTQKATGHPQPVQPHGALPHQGRPCSFLITQLQS